MAASVEVHAYIGRGQAESYRIALCQVVFESGRTRYPESERGLLLRIAEVLDTPAAKLIAGAESTMKSTHSDATSSGALQRPEAARNKKQQSSVCCSDPARRTQIRFHAPFRIRHLQHVESFVYGRPRDDEKPTRCETTFTPKIGQLFTIKKMIVFVEASRGSGGSFQALRFFEIVARSL